MEQAINLLDRKGDMMKKPQIKVRLFFKTMLLILIAVFISTSAMIIVGGYLVQTRMNNYFKENHESRMETIVQMVQSQLINGIDGTQVRVPNQLITQAGIQSLMIKNNQGEVLTEIHAIDKPIQKEPHGIKPPPLINKLIEMRFDLKQESYPIVENNQTIGSIHISYLNRTTLAPRDIAFKNSVTQSFQIVIVISLLTALIISTFFSRSITKPIYKINKAAKQIQKGQLSARADPKTNTKELVELSNTINYLSETLQQEDYLRKQLTADMAHEIRTPLTTVSTFIEAFIDGVWEPNKTNLSKCYHETERLNKLVDQLKDIANIEASNITYHNEPINLSDDLISIIDIHRPIMAKKNLSIRLNINPDIYISIDKHRLKQIVDNLLSNAYRYTMEHGHVGITLLDDQENVYLSVEDNGIGISQEDQPYIFKRFYRADKSRNKETGGMGIGLTIVDNILKLYNGKIHVSSTLGKGSTFTITLPKASL